MTSSVKISEHIAYSFQIISSTAFKFVCSIQTLISQSPCGTLIFLKLDVFSSFWVKITLHKPKVYNMYNVLLFPNANQKVLRFYITMNETFTMEVLDSSYTLNCQESKGLKRKFPLTEYMESLQARS